MTKYLVTACSINRHDFTMMEYQKNGKPTGKLTGEELIDTSVNELFFGADTLYEVEDRYEAFWNRLNGGYNNRYIVKVLEVRLAKDED